MKARLHAELDRELGGEVPTLETLKRLPFTLRIIKETLRLEETRFRRTLARGLTLLEEATAGLGNGATLSGHCDRRAERAGTCSTWRRRSPCVRAVRTARCCAGLATTVTVILGPDMQPPGP